MNAIRLQTTSLKKEIKSEGVSRQYSEVTLNLKTLYNLQPPNTYMVPKTHNPI